MVIVRGGGYRMAPYVNLDHRAVQSHGIASHERFVVQTPHGIAPPVFGAHRGGGFRRPDMVVARSGLVVFSELDGRAHVVPFHALDADVQEGHHPYGLDAATQTLRTDNTDEGGDDEADEEDDEVEMLYE